MAFIEKIKKGNWILAAFCLGIVLTASVWFLVSYAHSQEESNTTKLEKTESKGQETESGSKDTIGLAVGLVAAALATGMSSLGAAWAVSTVGTAAVGSLAEDPESLGGMIIFVGLAEGIAIYGLIISILILGKL